MIKIKIDHAWHIKTDVDLLLSQRHLNNCLANASNQKDECNLLSVKIKNK